MGMMTGGTPMPQPVGQGRMAQMPNRMMTEGTPARQNSSDPSLSHGGYNGTVDVQGQQIEVKNGVVEVEGKPYFISDNGAMVVNHLGKLVGHVTDGKFEVITPEYMNKMAEAGYIR